MNSFYHLREYDHKDNMSFNHRGQRDHSRLSRRRHFGQQAGAGGTGSNGSNGVHDHAHEQHTEHVEHTSDYEQAPTAEDGPAAEPPVSSELTYSGREMDVYRVLVAVERGEISAQEAARKLEEMEESASSGQDQELI